MRSVAGEVTSSHPISLSKAAGILSRFAASETGARPDVAAYLRRAVSAFSELVSVHREIRAYRKISHDEEKEVALPQEEENSRSKEKNKRMKGEHYDGEAQAGYSIMDMRGECAWSSNKKVKDLGILLNELPVLASALGANEVADVMEKEGEKNGIRSAIESNGLIDKRKKGKKNKDKKMVAKEDSDMEIKNQEIEYDNDMRSDERMHQKDSKRKGQLKESNGFVLISESMDSKRKKSDAKQQEVDWEKKQQERRRKRKGEILIKFLPRLASINVSSIWKLLCIAACNKCV